MKQVENNRGGTDVQFGGKLVSISDKVLTNVNKKNYKVVTIDFEDVAGNPARCSALCYEGNYNKGVEVGETYLCTATPTDAGVIVKMSHLSFNGERASAEQFGFETAVSTPVGEPNKAFDTQE